MTETTARDVAQYLEEHLRTFRGDSLLQYGDLITAFDDLPPLDEKWLSHPLCRIFDELDREDAALGRPFRTAIVVSKEEHLPGDGFFKVYAKYKNNGREIPRGERVFVHAEQLRVLVEYYSK
jgi:hypothetical protein